MAHHAGWSRALPPPSLPPPPPPALSTDGGLIYAPVHHGNSTMHMAFYWGTNAVVLFPGWPGGNKAMYAVAVVFVFALSVLTEFLAHFRQLAVKPGASAVPSGLFQVALHGVRWGMAYMVMLAVMSFNGGVFIAAVVGHALGFAIFGRSFGRRTAGSG